MASESTQTARRQSVLRQAAFVIGGLLVLVVAIATVAVFVPASLPTGELDIEATKNYYAELGDYAQQLAEYRERLKDFERRVMYREAALIYRTDAPRGDISEAQFMGLIAPSLLPARSGYLTPLGPILDMTPEQAEGALASLHKQLDNYREQLVKFEQDLVTREAAARQNSTGP